MPRRNPTSPRQQRALDSHREALVLTTCILAEWAKENGTRRDGAAESILLLLASCERDTNGDQTLDAVSGVFEEHAEVLSPALAQQLGVLAAAAHGLARKGTDLLALVSRTTTEEL